MEPFVGEIKMVAFDWAPDGWAVCNGSELPIKQNPALFALIGNRYGGDGQTTLALPDLRGVTPLSGGNSVRGYPIARQGGTETVTLTAQQMPSHNHDIAGNTSDGTVPAVKNNYLSSVGVKDHTAFAPGGSADLLQLNSGQVGSSGGNGPHDNMQPFAVVNFCIAMKGIFPPRQ